MKRREFIAGLGAATTWPLIVRAQPAMPVIGFLSSRSPDESAANVAAFRRGLGETGFIEGQNVSVQYLWAEGRYDLLPALAAELVGKRVAVLFAAGGSPAALAAKAATSTIPVVFPGANDPVGLGLFASLNRPGGNVTGMSTLTTQLIPKRVELLRELIPKVADIAYLVNPLNPSAQGEAEEASTATAALGIKLHIIKAGTDDELEHAFKSLAALHADGLVVAAEPFLDTRRERIVALVAQQAIPTSYAWRENVSIGGLISYGIDIADSYRRAGGYAGRILKGEKPADLPVMQPTKFELLINLKTAKALGIEIPPALLARADDVIE